MHRGYSQHHVCNSSSSGASVPMFPCKPWRHLHTQLACQAAGAVTVPSAVHTSRTKPEPAGVAQGITGHANGRSKDACSSSCINQNTGVATAVRAICSLSSQAKGRLSRSQRTDMLQLLATFSRPDAQLEFFQVLSCLEALAALQRWDPLSWGETSRSSSLTAALHALTGMGSTVLLRAASAHAAIAAESRGICPFGICRMLQAAGKLGCMSTGLLTAAAHHAHVTQWFCPSSSEVASDPLASDLARVFGALPKELVHCKGALQLHSLLVQALQEPEVVESLQPTHLASIMRGLSRVQPDAAAAMGVTKISTEQAPELNYTQAHAIDEPNGKRDLAGANAVAAYVAGTVLPLELQQKLCRAVQVAVPRSNASQLDAMAVSLARGGYNATPIRDSALLALVQAAAKRADSLPMRTLCNVLGGVANVFGCSSLNSSGLLSDADDQEEQMVEARGTRSSGVASRSAQAPSTSQPLQAGSRLANGITQQEASRPALLVPHHTRPAAATGAAAAARMGAVNAAATVNNPGAKARPASTRESYFASGPLPPAVLALLSATEVQASRQLMQLNCTDVSELLYAWGSLRYAPADSALTGMLVAHAMGQRRPMLRTYQVVTLLFACVHLHHVPQKLVVAVSTALVNQSVEHNKAARRVPHSSKQDQYDGAASQHGHQPTAAIQLRLHELGSSEVAKLTWALARLQQEAGPGQDLLPQPAVHVLAGVLQRRLKEFDDQALVTALWALASLGHDDPAVLDHLASRLTPRLPSLPPQELCMALWGMARLLQACRGNVGSSMAPITLLRASFSAASSKAGQLTARGLAMIAWAYATAQMQPPQPLLDTLARQALVLQGQMTLQGWSMLVWAFAQWGSPVGLLLESAALHVARLLPAKLQSMTNASASVAKNKMSGAVSPMQASAVGTSSQRSPRAQQSMRALAIEVSSLVCSYAKLGHTSGPLLGAVAANLPGLLPHMGLREAAPLLWGIAEAARGGPPPPVPLVQQLVAAALADITSRQRSTTSVSSWEGEPVTEAGLKKSAANGALQLVTDPCHQRTEATWAPAVKAQESRLLAILLMSCTALRYDPATQHANAIIQLAGSREVGSGLCDADNAAKAADALELIAAAMLPHVDVLSSHTLCEVLYVLADLRGVDLLPQRVYSLTHSMQLVQPSLAPGSANASGTDLAGDAAIAEGPRSVPGMHEECVSLETPAQGAGTMHVALGGQAGSQVRSAYSNLDQSNNLGDANSSKGYANSSSAGWVLQPVRQQGRWSQPQALQSAQPAAAVNGTALVQDFRAPAAVKAEVLSVSKDSTAYSAAAAAAHAAPDALQVAQADRLTHRAAIQNSLAQDASPVQSLVWSMLRVLSRRLRCERTEVLTLESSLKLFWSMAVLRTYPKQLFEWLAPRMVGVPTDMLALQPPVNRVLLLEAAGLVRAERYAREWRWRRMGLRWGTRMRSGAAEPVPLPELLSDQPRASMQALFQARLAVAAALERVPSAPSCEWMPAAQARGAEACVIPLSRGRRVALLLLPSWMLARQGGAAAVGNGAFGSSSVVSCSSSRPLGPAAVAARLLMHSGADAVVMLPAEQWLGIASGAGSCQGQIVSPRQSKHPAERAASFLYALLKALSRTIPQHTPGSLEVLALHRRKRTAKLERRLQLKQMVKDGTQPLKKRRAQAS